LEKVLILSILQVWWTVKQVDYFFVYDQGYVELDDDVFMLMKKDLQKPLAMDFFVFNKIRFYEGGMLLSWIKAHCLIVFLLKNLTWLQMFELQFLSYLLNFCKGSLTPLMAPFAVRSIFIVSFSNTSFHF
jgi:hypothetical protein